MVADFRTTRVEGRAHQQPRRRQATQLPIPSALMAICHRTSSPTTPLRWGPAPIRESTNLPHPSIFFIVAASTHAIRSSRRLVMFARNFFRSLIFSVIPEGGNVTALSPYLIPPSFCYFVWCLFRTTSFSFGYGRHTSRITQRRSFLSYLLFTILEYLTIVFVGMFQMQVIKLLSSSAH